VGRSQVNSGRNLDVLGFEQTGEVFWNLGSAELYEEAVRRGEAQIAHLGPLVARTGQHTGRSPKDKFVVRDAERADEVWWGANNQPLDPDKVEPLLARMRAYVRDVDLFVQDCYVGADARYRMPIRVVTEYAWHSLFARNLFIQPPPDAAGGDDPQFTVIDLPQFHADPSIDGTNSETFIVVDFARKLVLIGGTEYAGEIKKSMFTVMNHRMPKQGVLPMHCSANVGPAGDVALFFGLSGTGKTTLSTDPMRPLIGDDEHGWTDQGVFNFEGGCYAKTIRLSAENEPEIFQTTRRFGTILENVIMDPATRRVDLDSEEITENTRGAYPISHLDNAVVSGTGGHPRNIVFLTADAFGVLPPISRLTPEQAMYHFLLGYTARVAGTERGVTEPEATFSPCFGAPFLPLPPTAYATLLGEKLAEHPAQVWLINTGWAGGPAGESERIKLPFTRAMVRAALSGALDKVAFETEPAFGLSVPTTCPDVPPEILRPRLQWADGERYDAQAARLAGLIREAFTPFEQEVAANVREAAPA
jgi:phosphoenolpyruvate carboxykinase (ATP)